MRVIRLGLVLVAFLLSAVPIIHSESREKPFVWERDLVYSRENGVDLMLDIVWPSKIQGPLPAVIYLPRPESGTARSTYSMQLFSAARKGFIGVTLDYHSLELEERGKAKYRFPAQLLDIKAAIRWLRTNAEQYFIDPSSIGVIGWSYGGYLALMAGFTGPGDGFEEADSDTRVQAVVSLAGFTDWTLMDESDAEWSLGGKARDMPAVYRRASPLTYVREDSPPVLLIHGDKDVVIPPEHTELLDKKLAEAGVEHATIIVEGEDHLALAAYVDKKVVWDFFNEHLKPREPPQDAEGN